MGRLSSFRLKLRQDLPVQAPADGVGEEERARGDADGADADPGASSSLAVEGHVTRLAETSRGILFSTPVMIAFAYPSIRSSTVAPRPSK